MAKLKEDKKKQIKKPAVVIEQPVIDRLQDIEARRTRLKALIVLGKERGYLTYAEINDHLPEKLVDHEILEAIVSMLNEIIEALARRGDAVILSRVGFAVLGSFGDVLNVYVQAPSAQRLAAVMTSEGLTDSAAAEERVRAEDTVQRQFVQRFYDRHWDDPSGYGLILDTGSLSVEAAAIKVIEAARSVAATAVAGDAPTTAVLEVDPVLADAVESVLAEPVPG